MIMRRVLLVGVAAAAAVVTALDVPDESVVVMRALPPQQQQQQLEDTDRHSDLLPEQQQQQQQQQQHTPTSADYAVVDALGELQQLAQTTLSLLSQQQLVYHPDPLGLNDTWCFDQQDPVMCAHYHVLGLCSNSNLFRHCRQTCGVFCGEYWGGFLGVPQHVRLPVDMDDINGTVNHNVLLRRKALHDTVTYYRTMIQYADLDYQSLQACRLQVPECLIYQARGECLHHPQFMQQYCGAACQACGRVTPTAAANATNATGKNMLGDLKSIDYWRSVAAQAGVPLDVGVAEPAAAAAATDSDDPSTVRHTAVKSAPLDQTAAATMRQAYIRNGFVSISNFTDQPITDGLSDTFVELINYLVDHERLPASFLLLYDQAWDVVNALAQTLRPVLGLPLSHDIYVFHVNPGGPGWNGHRDRTGSDWGEAFFRTPEDHDDCPVWTNVWVALTDATQETSAMFFLPAHVDPEYKSNNTGPDVNTVLDIIRNHHRHIQYAEARTGTALVWSHRVIHWSSTSPPDAPHPRIALAFSMADPAYERILAVTDYDQGEQCPPFGVRLALLAYTGIAYHYNFYAPVKQELLGQLFSILADPVYGQHLDDEALSPSHGRHMGKQFLKYIRNIYLDDDLGPKLREPIHKLARYMVHVRGLSPNAFVRALAAVDPSLLD